MRNHLDKLKFLEKKMTAKLGENDEVVLQIKDAIKAHESLPKYCGLAERKPRSEVVRANGTL